MPFSIEEKNMLWKRLNDRWNISPWSYWDPLSIEPKYKGNDILALDSELFEQEFGIEKLHEILKGKGISDVLRVSFDGDIDIRHEIDINQSKRENVGLDVYWCTIDLNWIIYTTHEVTITFAGSWIVEQIKEKYTNWQDNKWR